VTTRILPRFLHSWKRDNPVFTDVFVFLEACQGAYSVTGLTEDRESKRRAGQKAENFLSPGTAHFTRPTVPSRILLTFLRFWKRPERSFGTVWDVSLEPYLPSLGRWDGLKFRPQKTGEIFTKPR
jgi:hypothetical protein